MYQTNDAGIEEEYFNIVMENVKITAITPNLHSSGVTSTHLEDIELRYEKILWKYIQGNIIYEDSWNHRVFA